MGNKPDVIELNGRKYNAVTGRIIPRSELTRDKSEPKKVHHTNHPNQVVDGFVKQPKKTRPAHSKAPVAPGVHKKATKSKTLMRSSVTRPPISALHGAIDHGYQVRSSRVADIDAKRSSRAKKVSKSSLISKFGNFGSVDGTVKKSTKALPVKPEAIVGVTTASGQAAVSSSPVSPFSHALDHATSHLQTKAKKPKLNHRVAHKLRISPRTFNVALSCFALLLLVGFFAYQNVPYLAVRMASTRANVQASLPGYHPSGFALSGNIKYKPGEVSYGYKSNSDERNFSVTQATSNWNSEALIENYVATNHRQYQTFEAKGKTIYIYDGSNATWVNGGIWYRIEGDSSLSSDQLLRLANSM